MKRFLESHPHECMLYNDLVRLLHDFTIYNQVYKHLYRVSNVTKTFEELDFLSDETKSKMQVFQDKWYSYIQSTTYARDSVFVFLDKAFLEILDHELLSFMKSFNHDLIDHEFTDITEMNILERKFPTNKDILRRARALKIAIRNNELL